MRFAKRLGRPREETCLPQSCMNAWSSSGCMNSMSPLYLHAARPHSCLRPASTRVAALRCACADVLRSLSASAAAEPAGQGINSRALTDVRMGEHREWLPTEAYACLLADAPRGRVGFEPTPHPARQYCYVSASAPKARCTSTPRPYVHTGSVQEESFWDSLGRGVGGRGRGQMGQATTWTYYGCIAEYTTPSSLLYEGRKAAATSIVPGVRVHEQNLTCIKHQHPIYRPMVMTGMRGRRLGDASSYIVTIAPRSGASCVCM